jgi:cation-transporting P-type ATPase 13A2
VDPEHPEIANSDNTVLFLISCYQYILIAMILSVGAPYRQPVTENGSGLQVLYNLVPFMVTLAIATIFTTVTILISPGGLSSVLQLTEMSFLFALLLIGIAAGNFIVSWFSERIMFPRVRRYFDRISIWRRKRRRWDSSNNVKRYQAIEDRIQRVVQ